MSPYSDGHDTWDIYLSGVALVLAIEDDLKAISADRYNSGVTTPILHYLVRSINTEGGKESYGENSEKGYSENFSKFP
jgi:phosphoacetylglucosamine mutase